MILMENFEEFFISWIKLNDISPVEVPIEALEKGVPYYELDPECTTCTVETFTELTNGLGEDELEVE